MKKIAILVTCYLLLVTCYFPVFAQEEDDPTSALMKKNTASPTSPPEEEKSKIDEIKDKIASTVAQLNLVSKKGFVGQISKLEKNQITIDKFGETRIIDTDELTTYNEVGTGKKKTEIEFKDLDVGDNIVTVGIYNKDSRRLLARNILVKEVPLNLTGTVKEVDITGGTITIEDKKLGKYVLDIEKTTQTQTISNTQALVKSGLSKVEIGQRIHARASLNPDKEGTATALRILHFMAKTASTPSSTPSGEVKETTPTAVKAPTSTPRPTKKPTATPIETP